MPVHTWKVETVKLTEEEMSMYTTLNKIKCWLPCSTGWRTLIESLNKAAPDDEPLHVLDILKSNGLEDAVWALKAFSPDQCRMLAIGAARQLQHVWSDAETLLDMAEAYVIKKPEAPSLIELTKQITLARYKAESDTRTDAEKTAQRAMYYSLKTAMAMPTSISAMSGMAESALLLVNYAGSLQDVPEYDPVGTFTKACIFVEERGVD